MAKLMNLFKTLPTWSSSKGNQVEGVQTPPSSNSAQAPEPVQAPPAPPAPTKSFWDVEVAELVRRHKSEHGRNVFQKEDEVHTPMPHNTPYLTVMGATATVVVGKHPHPMIESEDPDLMHFVTHIYVLDQTGKCVAMEYFDPSTDSEAHMTFSIPASATTLQPYEYWNREGLWAGPAVAVSNKLTAISNRRSVNPSSWKYIIADLYRQHKKDHNDPGPFLGHPKEKHTPYISFHADKVRVTVGNDHAFHCMKDSTNPAEVHYITYIYMLDENNKCVAMEAPDPVGVERCIVEFDVPKGVHRLTPYSMCNLHGLWVGPSVDLVTRNQEEASPVLPVSQWYTPNQPPAPIMNEEPVKSYNWFSEPVKSNSQNEWRPNAQFEPFSSHFGGGQAFNHSWNPSIVDSSMLPPGSYENKWGCVEVVPPSQGFANDTSPKSLGA
eukprot:gnl/MRDRNA2_/MRDRNA2_86071_c0_seq2.p1 gnl/MRDRNA2_/MRDRNA2_86071_c0~~gnl/MRDRNA2_/MRDRNA2_86071_c0_seq2.p1  ORF type:complete len:437 (+),score=48.54 gnl/MRDRNA2_/MRDRNA2_86071_c0_seq2:142-1452(+)